MGIGRSTWQARRRAPWTAALAMLALTVQLLIPAAAMAHAAGAQAMVICTPQGAVTVAADHDGQPAKGFAGLACQDCVMAAVAALPVPAPHAVPVRYAARAVSVQSSLPGPEPRSRAPPRPPSQGPPILSQA